MICPETSPPDPRKAGGAHRQIPLARAGPDQLLHEWLLV